MTTIKSELLTVPIDSITPHPDNPNKGDVEGISGSIKALGMYRVLTVQKSTMRILAGEHTWRGSKLAGETTIDIKLVDVDHARAMRIMLADNKWGEAGKRDPEKLASVLDELLNQTDEGLLGSGYSMEEYKGVRDLLDLESKVKTTNDNTDTSKDVPRAIEMKEKWKTDTGQVWRIASKAIPGSFHYVACAKDTDPLTLEILARHKFIKLGFHDPPYGTGIAFGEGAMGEANVAKTGFGSIVKRNTYLPVANDGEPFDPRHLLGLSEVCALWGGNYFSSRLPDSPSWIVWDKRVDLPSLTFADGELVWVSDGPPLRIVRHRWYGFLKDSEIGQTRYHPTQKPIQVQAEIIAMLTQEGDVVIDLYAGSGSTLLACERLGRLSVCTDMEPAYLAVMLERANEEGLSVEREK